MNPFETFESFDMTTLDDFLGGGGFQDEELTGSSGNSAASSFSDSFLDMPVYRSLEVLPADMLQLESQSGIDRVFEPPVLSRQAVVKAVHEPVEDLFAQLEEDCAHSCLPCVTDDLLGGIAAATSVEVESDLAALTSSITSFLQSRGVHQQHCEASSLWSCESTHLADSCRFRIQVYSGCEQQRGAKADGHFTVEFLRTSGSSLLFSGVFLGFKGWQAGEGEESGRAAAQPSVSALAPADLSESQAALEAFTGWASVDLAEAARAVCGLFCGEQQEPLPLLALLDRVPAEVSAGEQQQQLGPEGIVAMTLLGSLCVEFKQADEAATQQQQGEGGGAGSWLPMLSVLHLLLQTKKSVLEPSEASSSPRACSALVAVLSALIDSLVPATARLATAAPSATRASGCERVAAVRVMDLLGSCA